MKTRKKHFLHRTPGLITAILSVLVIGVTVTGCQDDKIEAPDLEAEVGFIGDTIRIANTSETDWQNVNVMIDEDFAYHIDKIPAKTAVAVDLIKFENEEALPFPAGMRAPESVYIDCDMGIYWGEFDEPS